MFLFNLCDDGINILIISKRKTIVFYNLLYKFSLVYALNI